MPSPCRTKTSISRAPGVGPKVAVRIVTELKNKAPAFSGEIGNLDRSASSRSSAKALPQRRLRTRVSALTNLGYSRDQAANAVAAALKNGGRGRRNSAKLIRLGLKELSR